MQAAGLGSNSVGSALPQRQEDLEFRPDADLAADLYVSVVAFYDPAGERKA